MIAEELFLLVINFYPLAFCYGIAKEAGMCEIKGVHNLFRDFTGSAMQWHGACNDVCFNKMSTVRTGYVCMGCILFMIEA